MQVISLWQPWASLLGFEKGHETRGWYTNYRGKLAVHSTARKVNKSELELIIGDIFFKSGIEQATQIKEVLAGDLPLQKIVSVVELEACRIMVDRVRAYGWKDLKAKRLSPNTRVEESKEELFEESGFGAVRVDEPLDGFLAVPVDQDEYGKWHEAIVISQQHPLEIALGLWQPRRFAWEVRNAVKLPEPIHRVGQQGLKPLAGIYQENIRKQFASMGQLLIEVSSFK